MRIFLAVNIKYALFFLLLSGCFWLCPYNLHADDEKVASKKAELVELKQKIAELQEKIQQRQAILEKEDRILKDVDLRINKINGNIRDLESRKSVVQQELSGLQSSRQKTSASLQKEQKVLGQHLRSAYISGHEEYIKLLMNQQDPATISRILVYYRYLTASRVRIINRINQSLEQLRLLEAGIQQRSAELKSLIDTQQEKRHSLSIAHQEQKTAVAVMRSELAGTKQQVERLQQDEKELLRLIDRLQEIIDELVDEERTGTSFRDMQGSLKLPVDAEVAVNFGARRQIGNLRWKGILLAGKLGSDIHAVYAGRVVYADWMRGFGLLLIIDHGDSYLSLYGHNESLLAEEGDWVETGQAIATMGKSGGSSKPSLYFEIRYKGTPQNPLRWARR